MDQKRLIFHNDVSEIFLREGNILHIKENGRVEESDAEAVGNAVFDYVSQASEAANLLVDLTETLAKPSPKTRRVWRGIAEDERVRRIAVFGGKPFVRGIAYLMVVLSRRKNVRLFATEDEAVAWLKEK